jgi:hypothetical protein
MKAGTLDCEIVKKFKQKQGPCLTDPSAKKLQPGDCQGIELAVKVTPGRIWRRPKTFLDLNGDSRNSAIKQVVSRDVLEFFD